MAFDPIVGCLTQITDYARYERFCTDLMRFDGYVGIEPLGGGSDKNRDSVLLRDGEQVVFHYSVRKDWKTKLWEDAEGVRHHGHACTKIVSVNPAEFTTSERDNCIKEFIDEFGWPLELYGVERIASMLRTNASELLKAYPQIFVPELIGMNRSAQLDVRISPTRDKWQQLAGIVAYNKGPGPVLVDAWFAEWRENDVPHLCQSIDCYRGTLPVRLEEKEKLQIIVPLDFAWQGLEKLGLEDGERRRHETTADNVQSFLRTAREHMPPRKSTDRALSLDQIRVQAVSIEVKSDRAPGCKHDRLKIVFRNESDLPLKTMGARIEWSFDTERALAQQAHVTGPKVALSGSAAALRRVGQNDTSSKGNEVVFVMRDEMASWLVELITHADRIMTVKAVVNVAPNFEMSEIDGVRETATSVAQSVLDSWK